ncbi:MAG TPA: hypothetical protein H9919_06605, partial [Candidatus Alistipes excrementipullorum]|nr:hypothetical protein [Candidatus Alistipes excrementipullorum]
MNDELFTYTEDEVRELVLKLHPRITAYIRGILGGGKSKVQADDIFHDVLFTFLDRRIKIPASKVQAYLYRMVKNKCLNMVTRPNIESSSISIDNITASAWETLASLDFTAQIPEVEEDTMPEINEIIAYSGQLPE